MIDPKEVGPEAVEEAVVSSVNYCFLCLFRTKKTLLSFPSFFPRSITLLESLQQAEQASIAAVDEVNMSEGEEDEDTEKAE